jgi:hypothetical protein
VLHPLYFILGFPVLIFGTSLWLYVVAQYPFVIPYRVRGLLAATAGISFACLVCIKKKSSAGSLKFAVIVQSILLVLLLPVLFSWFIFWTLMVGFLFSLALESYSHYWIKKTIIGLDLGYRSDIQSMDPVCVILNSLKINNGDRSAISPTRTDRVVTFLSITFAVLDIGSLVLIGVSVMSK